MAKEAGKTGNPPPPIVRPPMLGGPMGPNPADKFDSLPHMGSGHPPMPTLRPPTGLINAHLPPLEPLPLGLRDALPNLPPPPQLIQQNHINVQFLFHYYVEFLFHHIIVQI